MLQEIVEERELSYHYALHRITSRTLWQLAAWYCNSFILQLISCAIFILVLKVRDKQTVRLIKSYLFY